MVAALLLVAAQANADVKRAVYLWGPGWYANCPGSPNCEDADQLTAITNDSLALYDVIVSPQDKVWNINSQTTWDGRVAAIRALTDTLIFLTYIRPFDFKITEIAYYESHLTPEYPESTYWEWRAGRFGSQNTFARDRNGEEWSRWADLRLMNFLAPGYIHRYLDLLQYYIELNSWNADVSPHKNGFWIDWFSDSIWFLNGSETDSLDLDRDCLKHADDVDEIAAVQAAYSALIDSMRARWTNLVIVGNGTWARHDSTFAGKLDGANLEKLAQDGWQQGTCGELGYAIMPQVEASYYRSVPNMLANGWYDDTRGGPYILYDAVIGNRQAVAASLLLNRTYAVISYEPDNEAWSTFRRGWARPPNALVQLGQDATAAAIWTPASCMATRAFGDSTLTVTIPLASTQYVRDLVWSFK